MEPVEIAVAIGVAVVVSTAANLAAKGVTNGARLGGRGAKNAGALGARGARNLWRMSPWR